MRKRTTTLTQTHDKHSFIHVTCVDRSNVFWESLEEPKLNLDEFDDLFSKVPVQPKKKAKDTKPKAKAKQVCSWLTHTP